MRTLKYEASDGALIPPCECEEEKKRETWTDWKKGAAVRYKKQQKGNQLSQLWPYVTKVMFHEIDPTLDICQRLSFCALSRTCACPSGQQLELEIVRLEENEVCRPP